MLFFQKLRFGHSPLFKEIFLISFFAGFLVSMSFSIYQSFSDFNKKEASVLAQVMSIESALRPQLESALWDVDRKSVQRIINSLKEHPSVGRVVVRGVGFELIGENTSLPLDWSILRRPLVFSDAAGEHSLGELEVSMSKKVFWTEFKEELVIVVGTTFLKFLFLSGLLAWIFNRRVTMPVGQIQDLTRQFNQLYLSQIISVGDKSSGDAAEKNEIGQLRDDIEKLQKNFLVAFEKQRSSEKARVNAEIQLEKERQKIRLIQRLDSFGQITAQVVHDFGNIVMIINGKTTILDRFLQDEGHRKLTADIRKAALRAQNLIKKMLRMARYQDSDAVLFDPFKVLSELSELLKTAVGSANDLQIETDGSGGVIKADPSSFENALINLCVNARDAMPDGGRITVVVAKAVRANSDCVAISVQDTGSGIPDEIKQKIFDPFFTTKAPGKGTGLGLPQVQDFVKESGGWLELATGDEGSRFTLYLPDCRAEAGAHSAA